MKSCKHLVSSCLWNILALICRSFWTSRKLLQWVGWEYFSPGLSFYQEILPFLPFLSEDSPSARGFPFCPHFCCHVVGIFFPRYLFLWALNNCNSKESSVLHLYGHATAEGTDGVGSLRSTCYQALEGLYTVGCALEVPWWIVYVERNSYFCVTVEDRNLKWMRGLKSPMRFNYLIVCSFAFWLLIGSMDLRCMCGKDEKGRGRVVTSNSVSAIGIFTGVLTIGQT